MNPVMNDINYDLCHEWCYEWCHDLCHEWCHEWCHELYHESSHLPRILILNFNGKHISFFASIYYCDLVDQRFHDSEFLEQISISIDRYTAVSCGNLLKHSEMFGNIGIIWLTRLIITKSACLSDKSLVCWCNYMLNWKLMFYFISLKHSTHN